VHLINCPWCGPRAQIEFHYRCDQAAVPTDWENETVQQQHHRMLIRSNEIGYHKELWQHVHGCRSWLVVKRHNVTHDIRSVRFSKQRDGSENT